MPLICLLIAAILLEVTSSSAYPRKFIPAKAAIVVDSNKSVIYAKNPGAKLPPASTTKLVTAMVVLDHMDPASTIMISPGASETYPVGTRLMAYEEMPVTDLLHLALMKSVNSAAVALAEGTAGSEEDFVELMNQKAEAIGAINTRFANASGLSEGIQYTTVYDLTVILNEALKYPLIREILGKKEYSIATPAGRVMCMKNTNSLLWASNDVIGGKTGYTNSAKHCFVGALETKDGPILAAVLGTPSRWKLWKSTEALFSLGVGSNIVFKNIPIPKSKRVSKSKKYKVKHSAKKKHRGQKLARRAKVRYNPDRT